MPNDDTDVPAATVVEAHGLSKAFGGQHHSHWWQFRRRRVDPPPAVDGVSFTITAGSAVGYLGTGGAGKSTLVQLVTGASAPTGGTIRTCGLRPDTDREELGHRIGIVSGQSSQLWPDRPLEESLRMLAEAHELPDDRWRSRRTELMERLGLAAFITLPADQLSPGRRIRAEVAAALIHEPDLLVLDEPTAGLDVVSKEKLRTFLQQENRVHGRTLLLTTTDLTDVEQVCDRVLVVDRGRVVHDGDLPGLISRAGAQRTLVVDLTEAERRLDDVPGATLVSVEAGGFRQRLTFNPGSVPAARVLADVAARSGIRHLSVEEPDLDELIRRL